MTAENVRPFTPTRSTDDARRRQMRQQGHADGKLGRPKRWPDDPAYAASYRKGEAARGDAS